MTKKTEHLTPPAPQNHGTVYADGDTGGPERSTPANNLGMNRQPPPVEHQRSESDRAAIGTDADPEMPNTGGGAPADATRTSTSGDQKKTVEHGARQADAERIRREAEAEKTKGDEPAKVTGESPINFDKH